MLPATSARLGVEAASITPLPVAGRYGLPTSPVRFLVVVLGKVGRRGRASILPIG